MNSAYCERHSPVSAQKARKAERRLPSRLSGSDKTNRTRLAQRERKAGLETSAPPERRHFAGLAQAIERSRAERRLPSRLSANDVNEPDAPCPVRAQSRFGNQRSAGVCLCRGSGRAQGARRAKRRIEEGGEAAVQSRARTCLRII